MINWKAWIKAALIRAVKTFFQTFAGFITVGAMMSEIEWMQALSVAGVAFILSIVTSLGGLPEVDNSPKSQPPDEK